VHADEVHREARSPIEKVAALREAGALTPYVPGELGGDEASFFALAGACQELGRRCSSLAVVLAMHQIAVATIVRRFNGAYLCALCAEQRLTASVASEIGTEGDMGRLVAAVVSAGGGLRFEKQAPTVSYGTYADDLLTTGRRSAETEQSDQVIGIDAYENDSPYAVGRLFHDALSARLTLANERVQAIDASLLTIAKEV
jgi:acyl-CoA dehydrogenase